jgi:hypothetical protein
MAKTYYYSYTVFDGDKTIEEEAAYFTENNSVSDETVLHFLEEDVSDTFSHPHSELLSLSIDKVVS